MLLAAPSAAPRSNRGQLDGPKNLRVAAITPHSVTLGWDPAVNPGSFTYVIRASFGYQVGAPQTATSYTWTRDLVPGGTYSFVMWAGDARGRESVRSNTVTFDFGCETWLFWDQSVDDVDPQAAIRYEISVNGVFDGAQNAIDRWITYGTQSSNTYSVRAVDSAGNGSTSSITLDGQTC